MFSNPVNPHIGPSGGREVGDRQSSGEWFQFVLQDRSNAYIDFNTGNYHYRIDRLSYSVKLFGWNVHAIFDDQICHLLEYHVVNGEWVEKVM